MDLEYLHKQKEKYLDKMRYFDAIDFSNLSRTFQDVVDMIAEASPEEKQYLEKKITALASKVGQMK